MAAVQPQAGQTVVQKPIETLLRDCRHSFYLVFLFTFITEALAIAPMIYMWNVFDRVISARSGVTLVSLTILMMGLYLFWSAIDWMRTRLLIRISLRIDWDLASDIFDAVFRRSVTRQMVNVQQLMGDLVTVRQFLTGTPLQALVAAPFAVIYIIIGALFHPYLAAFIALSMVLMSASAYANSKVSAPLLKLANQESAESSRVAAVSIKSAETTLALGMLPAVRNRWYASHRNFLQLSVNASEATGLVGGLGSFLQKALPSLQIALGAYLAINDLITGGMVIGASMLISRAIFPLQRLMSSWSQIVGARVAMDRLNGLLIEDRKVAGRMSLPAPKGRLDVSGAAAIPAGSTQPVVADVSFTLMPGQAVAIIGPSGSGKTSLTRMLVGVWKPRFGSVRLDGVEISDWNHDEVGPHIGYVPQDISFMEATIAENIARLGAVDSDKVVEAAKLVDMHEAILALPEGYDTMLGDTGFALSGGQRQRIAIARAFYGNPKYIVMDEPNASLDEIGENALLKAVTELKAKGTSFAITTHRPRLMSVVDNLLVLRQGRQVGFGPAADMIAAVRNLKPVAATGDATVEPIRPASASA